MWDTEGAYIDTAVTVLPATDELNTEMVFRQIVTLAAVCRYIPGLVLRRAMVLL
jgi:hypothetical protein